MLKFTHICVANSPRLAHHRQPTFTGDRTRLWVGTPDMAYCNTLAAAAT